MSEYKPVFCVIPHRILYLEGLQLSYLKVYELFFQFWNHGKSCFLSNPVISERTQLADSTIREALAFFEKKGEMRRVMKGRKRYLLPPVQAIEVEDVVDKYPDNSSNSGHAAEIAAPTRCQVGGLPAAKSAHNINNINTNNIKKSSCVSEQQKTAKSVDNSKRHSWAEKPKSPFSDPTKQSTSYKPPKEPEERTNPEAVEAAMLALPRHMRPKRYREIDTGVQNVSLG